MPGAAGIVNRGDTGMPSPFQTARTAAAAAALAFAFAAGPAPAEPAKVTFLHVNDLDRMEEDEGKGGLARLAAVARQVAADAPDAILTHAGDAISPSLLSGFDGGAHMIDLLNEAGIDVMTLGNHEFDFGPDVAVERIAEARFPVVATNVSRDGVPLPGTQQHVIIERNGVRIGFYGLTTPTAAQLSASGDVRFLPLVETGRAAAAALRAQGADLVVALAHAGFDEDLALVRAEVADVILSGHDHVLTSYYDGRSVLVESASQADFVSVLEIAVERVERSDGTRRIAWTPEIRAISTADVEPDPRVAALVAAYQERLSSELDVPIGTLAGAMDSRRATVRGGEAAIGNLIADAMREAVGADVAITNGGGIRADRQYDPGTPLTRRDIQMELPFGNRTVKLEVTGAQVQAALENGVSQVAEAGGRFPQVSGLTFSYDPQAPAGGRVREVTTGGAPLDPGRTYSLATNDFMADGGDGYGMFRDARRLIDVEAGALMATQVMEHIRARGTVAPGVEGRITVAD
jgi:5'-nucleotidase/UDP-sugar diphosphatase